MVRQLGLFVTCFFVRSFTWPKTSSFVRPRKVLRKSRRKPQIIVSKIVVPRIISKNMSFVRLREVLRKSRRQPQLIDSYMAFATKLNKRMSFVRPRKVLRRSPRKPKMMVQVFPHAANPGRKVPPCAAAGSPYVICSWQTPNYWAMHEQCNHGKNQCKIEWNSLCD